MNGIGNVYFISIVNIYEIFFCKLYNSFRNIFIYLNGLVFFYMFFFIFRIKNSLQVFFFYIFKNDMNIFLYNIYF